MTPRMRFGHPCLFQYMPWNEIGYLAPHIKGVRRIQNRLLIRASRHIPQRVLFFSHTTSFAYLHLVPTCSQAGSCSLELYHRPFLALRHCCSGEMNNRFFHRRMQIWYNHVVIFIRSYHRLHCFRYIRMKFPRPIKEEASASTSSLISCASVAAHRYVVDHTPTFFSDHQGRKR